VIDSLGLSIPIIQAPMAGAGGMALAQAVHAAGGLGSLPCAILSNDDFESTLKTLNGASNAPFNVNFFTHTAKPDDAAAQKRWRSALRSAYDAKGLDSSIDAPSVNRTPFSEYHCEQIEKHPPAVVSFHFGLPEASLIKRVKAVGCQVWSTATTVAEARWLEDHGVDAIIAQGSEAGGHRGLFLDPLTGDEQTSDDIGLIAYQVGTLSLVPQIVDAVSVPVIAAGGIADGRGMAAAMMLGASAVQIGTAYLFSKEATITAMHRQALWTGSAEKTALTNVFSGKPARSAVNDVMRSYGPMSTEVPPFPTAAAALGPLKAAAEAQSSGDYSSLWSGQSAGLAAALVLKHGQADNPPSAQDLTQWIAQDAQAAIAAVAKHS